MLKPFGVEMFNIDLALEVRAIPQLHELVRIASVAVLAAKFATTIGVDHPAERHPRAGTLREKAARGEIEIFDVALGLYRRAFRGEAGNTNELGHTPSFAIYSPTVKRSFLKIWFSENYY